MLSCRWQKESAGTVSSKPCVYKFETHLMDPDNNSMQALSKDLQLKAYLF